MRSWFQAGIMTALGVTVLRLVSGGMYLNYVRPSMAFLLFASGFALLFVGIWSALRAAGIDVGGLAPRRGSERRSGRASASSFKVSRAESVRARSTYLRTTADRRAAGERRTKADPAIEGLPDLPSGPMAHTDGAGHHESHGHGPRVAWFLLAPVLVLLFVAPLPLGAGAAALKSGVVAGVPTDFAALPAGEPVDLTLYDYAARATWDRAGTLEGRTVRLLGFAAADDKGGWTLTRFKLQCCAADAAPVKVQVTGAESPGEGVWVEIVGRAGSTRVLVEGRLPVVDAQEVRVVEQPREPYL